MAFSILLKEKSFIFYVTLISFAMLLCYSGASAEDLFQGSSLTKALSCFDNKLIYVGCDEVYRLNPSGNINIPSEATDIFCNGPCLAETQVMLNCINNMLSNFLFYNKASVDQIRYVLNAGCSYSTQRGNFNLGEYAGEEINNGHKLSHFMRLYLFIAMAVVVYLM
ncbi:hypothetical protein Lal_00036629 [Lupinus albus]|uniref:DUF7731 domain-containing protein n=1 Tax=Lupinus albus TaxID=3870 RepID=A0A6A5P4D9_LUPAL|nr:hypothetical protein Lalb_Chr18g0046061 [Lupinus albus]KAF1892267.1 hypothetical protein Lal_00036629 [Lupinus albus]